MHRYGGAGGPPRGDCEGVLEVSNTFSDGNAVTQSYSDYRQLGGLRDRRARETAPPSARAHSRMRSRRAIRSARSIRLLGFDFGFATARWVHRVSERIPWRCPFASAGFGWGRAIADRPWWRVLVSGAHRAIGLFCWSEASHRRIVAYPSGYGWSEGGRAAELSGLLEAVGEFEQH
jgi:hypothetical protein